ncbi:unnamed protein product, partial [Ectocarpus fasciculatus]
QSLEANQSRCRYRIRMVPSLLHGAGHEHVDAAQRGAGAGGADVRDLAADAQKLAIAMASKTTDAQYTVQRLLTDHSPAVMGIHESLLAITAKIDLEVKTRREELLALAKMCTLVAAASVVVVSQEHEQEERQRHKQRQREQQQRPSGKGAARSASGSDNNGGGGGGGSERMMRLLDVGPLRECVEALGFLVRRKDARRRTLLRRSSSSSIKDEIADLNGRVLDAAREMGLAGILAVFKGVLEETGGGYGSSPGGMGDVLTQQEVDLARQPKRAPPRARVPSLLPRRESWHVRRELVIGTVLRRLLSAPPGGSDSGRGGSGDGYTAGGGGGRARGRGRAAGPRVVGLVGESGTGKTAAAAEVVRGPEVLEYFSDGVVWLPVNEGDGQRDRLPSLMKRLARLMYEEVGIKHGFVAPSVAGAGAVGSDDPWGGPRHDGGGSGSGAEDGGGGAAYVKALVEGGGQQQQQQQAATAAATAAAADGHGGARQRRPLRCLVAADNVCEAEVVAAIAETGVWVLLTTRDGDVIRRVGGKPVVVGRLLETDADWVLRRASELPGDESPPAGARELVELCGRTALDLAFVG